ncbi:MAG: response regulator [Deltaproteobacteria bacterium]|nr:response regulator [Deltaproteobacteria bacterium]
MAPLLEEEGYQVSLAENGREALRLMYGGTIPDIIVLDLRMPVMDGWEFRTLQKDDPKLGLIPVVALSADGSAQAAAISAQAHLRKPVEGKEFLGTIERVLFENKRQMAARLDETERLASLGRLAAGVGHEINNPLTFLLMNLGHSLEQLRPVIPGAATPAEPALSTEAELADLKARLANVADMLRDCQIGGDRIRETVTNLQRLSRQGDEHRRPIDVHRLIDQSVAMVWNQIRHRARLIKTLGKIPLIKGNGTALGQVFLNLLLNAAQAMPEGDATRHEIRVTTWVGAGKNGPEIVVEISDSGMGIAPGILSHVFEPFFTTKAVGQGTGLGLTVSRHTVNDHGGRITVESTLGEGTVFRVFLPVVESAGSDFAERGDVAEMTDLAETTEGPEGLDSRHAPESLSERAAPARGRILVIDDEPLTGRVIRNTLKKDHEVFVAERAADAVTRLENGETFDMVLCDVVMPDLSGPDFYAIVAARWPELVQRLVFMTGGAFTPETAAFIERVPTRVLSKPFKVGGLKRLVRERMRGNT